LSRAIKEVTVDPIRLVTLLWCCRKTRLDDDRCREVVDLLVQLGAETTDVYPSAKIYQPAVVTSEAES